MIDLHCHILPGLDDGPELLSESLQMARQAIADGIREIVATPHFLEWRPKAISSYLAQAVEARDEFARALKKDGLDLKVRLGFEVALSPELPELAAEFPALTFEGLQNTFSLSFLPCKYPSILKRCCLSSKLRASVLLSPILNAIRPSAKIRKFLKGG